MKARGRGLGLKGAIATITATIIVTIINIAAVIAAGVGLARRCDIMLDLNVPS